ncbi:aminoglycoside phosphotransferase family protein [Streptomyces rapamycinicus]|uniref:Aminoglycoside phosphotransferase (APT) family kinase protein n=1 Tax=Streptomyces rapamycinicus TaxID=1226757 RepID=A0ABR6LI43_9ACTN|nr:aminoglycoside phosphotransferase family protein [Streptomyces rapamycinicus]MBB4781203.1 aminoglycoside phosphotransferase (APT) family kinase protein [Streptomyces rapamycinicus]
MSQTAAQLVTALRRARRDATAEVTVLADRPDGTVVRCGRIVAKAHPPGTDPAELAVRLGVAAHPRCAEILLPPVDAMGALPDGRQVTLWPYGEPVAPDAPDAAPWAEAGRLLARLHSVPVAELPGPLPAMRGPAKAARAIARLRAAALPEGAATRAVLRAWAGLPGWARGVDRTDHMNRGNESDKGNAGSEDNRLCHGDLHLGQLIRHRATDWRLIDIDDLGLGDPAWDLARPAAWYAAGLLAAEDWERFLGAYRAAGGSAVGERDPWPRLDVPARALTVQTAALALAKAAAAGRALDEAEEAMVEASVRIAHFMEAAG